MSADFRRVIGDEEMRLFADLTGDTNPLHFDDDFAERSRFGGRIVHGMCTAALISTVIGTRMPGPGCIYLSQTLRFTAPVRPGDEIVARAVVDRLIPERRRVEFETTCSVGDQIVPRRPRARPGPLPRWACLAGGRRAVIARILKLSRPMNAETTSPPPVMIPTDKIRSRTGRWPAA